MPENYRVVLAGFANDLSLDPEAFIKFEEIVVNRVTVSFEYRGDDNDGDVLFLSHLGTPTDDDLPLLREQLLEGNYLWIGSCGCTLSLNPLTGEVALGLVVPIHRLGQGERRRELLSLFVQVARVWIDRISNGEFGNENAQAASLSSLESRV